MAPRFRAGFARCDVTPPAGTPMSGFVARTGGATGIHDRLWARAAAFDDGTRTLIAIVLDVLAVDAALTAAVRAAVTARETVAEGDVVLAATHTHGGPALLTAALLGTVVPGVRERLVEGAAAAALAALTDLSDAELTFAVGREATVARNRRVLDGVIDPDVPVALVRREGAVAGILTGYACHPVVLGPDNRRFTRDYPGAVIDALEERWPGAVALFLTGACGQINTGHPATASLAIAPSPHRTFAAAQAYGRHLAAAAVAVAQSARSLRPTPLRASRRSVSLPLAPPLCDPTAELAEWRAELARLAPDDQPRRADLEARSAWAERVSRCPPAPVEVEVACWSVGELAIAWFPGEVFVEHGLELKAKDDGPLIVVANALDAPGYVPHASAYPAGGYEVTEAFRYYGRPSPYAPTAGEALAATMHALLQEVRA
jgi:neutral ceramidase